MEGPGRHRALVESLGVDPPARDRLVAYLDLLAAWNDRVNLTAARTPEARFDLLVRPVVALARRVAPGSLLDIGSGNGSPGLILAALRPDVRATLLEPRTKRWAFLREAARTMDLRVDVLRQRHDEYGGPPARTVAVRALRLPPADLAALVESGGEVVVLGVALPPHPALTIEPGPALGGIHVYRRA